MATSSPKPLDVEIRVFNGRPTVFIDGVPDALPSYCPISPWFPKEFKVGSSRFFNHRMGAYLLSLPRGQAEEEDFFTQFLWHGDDIRPERVLPEIGLTMDEQAEVMLGDPDAKLIIRFGLHEPKSWRDLHPDQLVVNEAGEVIQCPSLASDLYWDATGRMCEAVVKYCESRPWSHRIIGYVNLHRFEGVHEPIMAGNWLFDHGPAMTARWRQFLREKYETVEALREAHNDPAIDFDTVSVPRDRLRGTIPQVSALLYWQNAKDNQPLRDYLVLQKELFHGGCRKMHAGFARATDRKRFYMHDAMKQPLAGWNMAFFDDASWPKAYPDILPASGSMGVAELFNDDGFDGLLTPHDYHARGIGGVYEPEGIVDSMVLRGKYLFSEMDTRTYTGWDRDYGSARDDREFAAITWRNFASALTRGYNSYWMDLATDWFASDEMHRTIARQVEVIRQSVNWPHEDVPGIAMILDDAALLETNGDGSVMHEAVMWEQKLGMARCGVPFRIYLLEDLELDKFPRHAVYYFPNLYRVDDKILALLQEKVFRDGSVVVWGPGSGISDGKTIGTQSAKRLTGLEFDILNINYPRRMLISNYTHPITKNLRADTFVGGPLSYGPILFPKDGESLAEAWTKKGTPRSGLAVKSFGRGGAGAEAGARGPGDWVSVFTTAVPLPADLWRGLAQYGGAHVYCQSNDVLVANRTLVGLHSLKTEKKAIFLPDHARVTDLITGEVVSPETRRIEFMLKAPGTGFFLLEPPGAGA